MKKITFKDTDVQVIQTVKITSNTEFFKTFSLNNNNQQLYFIIVLFHTGRTRDFGTIQQLKYDKGQTKISEAYLPTEDALDADFG